MASVVAWITGSGVVQGIIIGATLAFLTAVLVMNGAAATLTSTVNGWRSIRKVGQPGNGILVRAAGAKALPAVNSFEEAAYWTATRDDTNRTLLGSRQYVLTFPPGQLPPNDAFWSLTATDTVGYMVRNSAGRSSVNDRSDLVQNADGSVDIYLRHESPTGHEKNWLPIPAGKFKLMLRDYLPGPAVLDGSYRVPPIIRER